MHFQEQLLEIKSNYLSNIKVIYIRDTLYSIQNWLLQLIQTIV